MGPAARSLLRTGVALLLALTPWVGNTFAADAVYVVVSAQSPVGAVTQKEVLALFTGRSRTLAGGVSSTPLDQQRDGAARAAFYQALTGMDVARINSYWARLHFTGQVQPPQALGDDASVIERLRSDPAAIGYLAQPPADPAVRVVLRLP
jgi:ABC-type phosphate transport system substrate-binding protein